MYSETWNESQAFHGLKQSDTYGIEITAEDLQTAQRESPLIKKFIEMNARKNAIRQIDIALSIVGPVDTKERQWLASIKNVYEHLTDWDFAKYIYNEPDQSRVETYIHLIDNELTTKIPARQHMMMYLATMADIWYCEDRHQAERFMKLVDIISGMPDRTYINTVMDLMDASGDMVAALAKLLKERGVDMIKEAKEKREDDHI